MQKSEDKNLKNYSAKNFKYLFSDSLILQHNTFVGGASASFRQELGGWPGGNCGIGIWLNGAPQMIVQLYKGLMKI
jgi:hypothetical protein